MFIEANAVCTRHHGESPRLVVRFATAFSGLCSGISVSLPESKIDPGLRSSEPRVPPSPIPTSNTWKDMNPGGCCWCCLEWFLLFLPLGSSTRQARGSRLAARDAHSCSSGHVSQLLSNLVPISGTGQTIPSGHIVHVPYVYPFSPNPVSQFPPSILSPYSNSFQGILPNLLSVSSLPSPSRTPAVRRIRGSTASVSRTVWCVATPASYRSAK